MKNALHSCRPLLACLLFAMLSFTSVSAYDVVVAKDGSGDYTTIQAAINAAPAAQTTPYLIYIKNGRYREVVTIPANKPFLHLVGESAGNTIITYDNYSGKLIPGGGGAMYGTNTSATVFFNANDCAAFNLTMENAQGYVADGPQALALYVSGDRCVFKDCRFNSGQDTVWTNGDGKRSYFGHCYIDGNTDFIFGSMIAVFDSCVVFGRDRLDGSAGGYITAANTPAGQAYGYVFRDCLLPANSGVTRYSLGRPWQNDASTLPVAKKNNKVAFLNSRMGASIVDTGWSRWDAGTDVSLITYAEYRTRRFDGSLADVSRRVSWSQQLSDAAAAAMYVNANLFGAWDPCVVSSAVCAASAPPLAISNFRGRKGPAISAFRWNISWPVAQVDMDLYRSSDKVSFTVVNHQSTTSDSSVNFDYSEAVPPPGVTYYYYIRASKPGLTATTTDTVAISSTPTITVTGTMGSFLQGLGTPSATQAYVVSGVNLFSDVVITPPAGYELSLNGTNWIDQSRSITLAQTNGILANTTISVRLNGAAAGTYTGEIVHASQGADSVRLAVAGVVQSEALSNSTLLAAWPMTVSNADSAALRAPGVIPGTPALTRYAVSNGITYDAAALPAYSPAHGQVLSGSADGSGDWRTTSGGPGSTLHRGFYEQFNITAANTHVLKVDSFVLNSAFYATVSSTRIAVQYSVSGFTADSAEVSGGTAGGSPLTFVSNNNFVRAVALPQDNNGTTFNLRFALNGATGVTLGSGQSLWVRIYFSCGSTSRNRYAKVMDVQFKGLTSAVLPLNLISFRAVPVATGVSIIWNTTAESNTDYFEVERSSDGMAFSAIARVAAKNTLNAGYAVTDGHAPSGVNYYRLKMLDKDGTVKYSMVVVADRTPTGAITVFPNPATSTVAVTHSRAEAGARIDILTTDGKKVSSVSMAADATRTTIDVSGLRAGNYLLLITNGTKGRSSVKLVKQ